MTRSGWQELARPLIANYVDRLVAEIGTPPDPVKAEALTRRLPIRIRIEGPVVNWSSRSGAEAGGEWRDRHRRGLEDDSDRPPSPWRPTRLLADGHRIKFGRASLPRNSIRRVEYLVRQSDSETVEISCVVCRGEARILTNGHYPVRQLIVVNDNDRRYLIPSMPVGQRCGQWWSSPVVACRNDSVLLPVHCNKKGESGLKIGQHLGVEFRFIGIRFPDGQRITPSLLFPMNQNYLLVQPHQMWRQILHPEQ